MAKHRRGRRGKRKANWFAGLSKGKKIGICVGGFVLCLAAAGVIYAAFALSKIDTQDILVLHDDLDLPVGKIRIRYQGSSGGQKGLKNIIDLLGTQDIKRIRIGIGKDPIIPIVDYVLGKIPKEQEELFNESLDKTAKAARASLALNFQDVMNRDNR